MASPHFTRQWFTALAVVLGATTAGVAQAAVVTSLPVGLDTKTITFAPFDGVMATTTLPSGGTDIGSAEVGEVVMVSADEFVTSDIILGAVTDSFGGNGSWPVSGAYLGLNQNSGTLTIRFDRGLNFVGGLFNYLESEGAGAITALDINGDILVDSGFETHSFGFTAGAEFRGFLRSTADIYALQLVGYHTSVDNLVFGTTAGVPEPQAATLVLAALAALGWQRRRARAARR